MVSLHSYADIEEGEGKVCGFMPGVEYDLEDIVAGMEEKGCKKGDIVDLSYLMPFVAKQVCDYDKAIDFPKATDFRSRESMLLSTTGSCSYIGYVRLRLPRYELVKQIKKKSKIDVDPDAWLKDIKIKTPE